MARGRGTNSTVSTYLGAARIGGIQAARRIYQDTGSLNSAIDRLEERFPALDDADIERLALAGRSEAERLARVTQNPTDRPTSRSGGTPSSAIEDNWFYVISVTYADPVTGQWRTISGTHGSDGPLSGNEIREQGLDLLRNAFRQNSPGTRGTAAPEDESATVTLLNYYYKV